MFKFNRSTSQFVLDEGREAPSLASYIQSLKEIVYSLSPRSKTEGRRIEIAKSHLREINLYAKRLEEENRHLQEKLNLLEENKDSEE